MTNTAAPAIERLCPRCKPTRRLAFDTDLFDPGPYCIYCGYRPTPPMSPFIDFKDRKPTRDGSVL